ncbi:MAG TPA: DUF2892 domain-containing protein [Thiotrichales bacterium]|nr:DUF2892 domain-containing protein [Thiotrichales bacterium]
MRKRITIRPNVGGIDRMLRFLIGILLFYAGFLDDRYLFDAFSARLLGVMGTILLLTAIFRYCPAYSLARIDTTQRRDRGEG